MVVVGDREVEIDGTEGVGITWHTIRQNKSVL